MATSSGSSEFQQQIVNRLEASKADVTKHRDAMDHTMRELEEREIEFHKIADRIRSELIHPTLAAFAEHFSNATLEDTTQGYSVRCLLGHSIRFPARAHVSFRVTHNETIESLTIQYEAQILPVFIRFDRSDVLEQSMSDVDLDVVRKWAEQKLLGFLDSYLQIETHEQYQRENTALDPVCGMRVAKPKGLPHIYEGQTYYFCAQRCLDRFIENPSSYTHSTVS